MCVPHFLGSRVATDACPWPALASASSAHCNSNLLLGGNRRLEHCSALQVRKLDGQLQPLRTGKVTVSKEDNDALEKVFADYMNAWQRRKRMFNDVWCDPKLLFIACIPDLAATGGTVINKTRTWPSVHGFPEFQQEPCLPWVWGKSCKLHAMQGDASVQ